MDAIKTKPVIETKPKAEVEPECVNREEIKPLKNNEEAVKLALSLLINTPKDRLAETTQMPGFLIYDLTLDKVRERAYDLNRDPATEPLSMVDRDYTLQCLRGKNFKYAYLIGNLIGLAPSANTEEESFRRRGL